MQKHIQHNKDERTQFFWKIYLSLYLKRFERVTKGIICERWVGDWTELQHIDPQLFWLQLHFFLVLLGCLTGGLGAHPLPGHGSHSSIFLQLIWTSYRRDYIIIWRPPTSCERHICTQFNPPTVKVIPWSSDIFDWMYLLFTLVHFSSDSPAESEVNMLHGYGIRTD